MSHRKTQQDGYVEASSAASRVGYSTDYVTRLARAGKIDALRKSKQWLVNPESLKWFALVAQQQKRDRSKKLQEERIHERAKRQLQVFLRERTSQHRKERLHAVGETVVLMSTAVIGLLLTFELFSAGVTVADIRHGYADIEQQLVSAFGLEIPEHLSQEASFAYIYRPSDAKQNAVLHQNDEGLLEIDVQGAAPEQPYFIHTFFSDEVIIEENGDYTGVVTPVFRNATGGTYRYIIGPNQ